MRLKVVLMKKAQSAEQIFIYIVAIVVVGLIILYGYSAIKGFTQRGEEVEFITLKTGLENSFKSIVSDYGSVKRPDISVSSKYEMICFVDKSRPDGDIDNTAICNKAIADAQKLSDLYQPIMCAGWKTHRDSIFLLPDGSQSLDVGTTLVIKNDNQPYAGQPFLCIKAVNNKIKLQLAGLGDKVEASEYE